jgi:hypothetical protein
MRSYELTYKSFHNIVNYLKDNYEVDVFVHTWNMLEPETATHHNGPSKVKNREIKEEEIWSTYNPKAILIEKQKIKNDKTVLHNQSLQGLVYAEYSKYRVNELKKEKNKDYDVVICSRPDVIYYNPFYIEELEKNDRLWKCSVFHNGAASDVVMFGGSSIIDQVREYYFSYEVLLSTFNYDNNEKYFDSYINDLDINIENSKYCMPRDWKLTRSWWGQDYDLHPDAIEDPYTWSKESAEEAISSVEFFKRFR